MTFCAVVVTYLYTAYTSVASIVGVDIGLAFVGKTILCLARAI